jgi:hypothetical protein
MTGVGIWTETFAGLFALACRKAGLEQRPVELNIGDFRRPGPFQPELNGLDV